MGDRMQVQLTLGPVTADQKANVLVEVMEDMLSTIGLPDLEPESVPGDPRRVLFTIDEINGGIEGVCPGGRIQALIDASIPYRIADDGGAYYNGNDAIWHPDFGPDWILSRATNQDCEPVLDGGVLSRFDRLTGEGVGRIVRGYLQTDPSHPDLLETARFLRYYLRPGSPAWNDKGFELTADESMNRHWWRVVAPNGRTVEFHRTESSNPTSLVNRIVFKDGNQWVSFSPDELQHGRVTDLERLNEQEVIELIGAID